MQHRFIFFLSLLLVSVPGLCAAEPADCRQTDHCFAATAEPVQEVLVKTRVRLATFPATFAGLTLVPSKCAVVSADRNTYLFVVQSSALMKSILATLMNDPQVIWAQPNFPYKP